MKQWQNVQFSYTEEQENGNIKVKKENHLVEAESFVEAETRAYELFSSDYENMKVLAIKKSKFSDVLDKGGENWYSFKVVYTTTSENGKEKHTNDVLLIKSSSVKLANESFEDFSSNWAIPFELVGITKTKLSDVWDNSVLASQDEDDEAVSENDSEKENVQTVRDWRTA